MKKILRKLLLTIIALIAVFIVLGLGFRLIDGRTPQAYRQRCMRTTTGG